MEDKLSGAIDHLEEVRAGIIVVLGKMHEQSKDPSLRVKAETEGEKRLIAALKAIHDTIDESLSDLVNYPARV